jgi:RNA polymerase sigma-70 factor (ECF subfamily)
MDFQLLLEPLRNKITSHCRHLLWNKNELEDALQEVILQALRSYGRYTPDDFKRWIFGVATHTVFNLNRKHRRRPLSLNEEIEISVEAELDLEDTYSAILKDPQIALSKMDEPLRSILGQLGETERAVFLLRSLGELKYKEIADVLSVPIGTVMGHLSRARMKLRKLLAERYHAM